MSNIEQTAWVEPTQSRSREKVSRMLAAATDLAVEQGSLDLKMTEVAKRAGVAIGTLYQFFPTRTALISKLFAVEMQPIDERVATALSGAASLADLSTRVERELRHQLRLVQSRSGLKVIWASASMDPAIEAADYQNTRQNADRLTQHLMDLLPKDTNRSSVHATALLICHLWGSVIRLCVLSNEGEEDHILRQYAGMLAAHGENLALA